MGAYPWMCAHCKLPPDWPDGVAASPCRKCGCVEFLNGSLYVRLRPSERLADVRFFGPMTRAFAAGPTTLDRRYLRSLRIGW